MRIDIKPLSVNQAWKGSRYKTPEYKDYEKHLLFMLKKFPIPDGELFLKITFGFSSRGSDVDNPAKPFIDILQKLLGFNDSRIYRLDLKKEIVRKGNEFIDFEIMEFRG